MLNFLDHNTLNEDELLMKLMNRFMNQFLLEPRQASLLAFEVFDLISESGTDMNFLNQIEY